MSNLSSLITWCDFLQNSIIGNGSINIKVQQIFLMNNVFSLNSAIAGTSLYYFEFFNSSRSIFIYNNSFLNNIAQIEGGAIKYLMKRPNIDKSNVFYGNLASYGNNIASYPVRMTMVNESGIDLIVINTANITMEFIFLDLDNQFCSNYQGYFVFYMKLNLFFILIESCS